MKHFAIVPSDIVAAYFFMYIQFFSGTFFFNQSQPWICMKQTKTTARLIRTCDTCAHPYILYTTHTPGIMIQLHYSSVAACIVGTHVDSVYYCCACARTRFIFYRTYFATAAAAAAVVVLQLLLIALSAAACSALYTAVYIVVCCYCWT